MYAKFSNFINWSMTSWPPSFWLSHHHHHQQRRQQQQQHCPQRFIIIVGCLMTITAQTITNQSPIMAVMANNDHEEHVVINTPSSIVEQALIFPQQNSIESPKLTHGNEVATKTFGLTSSTITNNHPKMTNLKFRSIFERMNGQQFIDIFDRLMNGKLSTIIEQIKANKNNRFDSIVPGKLSAIQLISLLDNFSSGEVSSNIASIIQSTKNRNRRSSFDSMTGLSIGYSKRGSRFDPMIGSTFGSPLKRGMNFDEMDHSGFAGFAKRRGSSSSATIDFDEMDNAGFAGFAKRLHNFDEIDRSGFSGFAKRSTDFNAIDHGRFAGGKRSHDIDFDEMDHSGFTNSFVKRLKESNIDEFDFDSKPINSNYRILLHQLLNRSNNRPYVGPFVLTTNNE